MCWGENRSMGVARIVRSRAVRTSPNMDIKAAVVVDRSGEQEGGNIWGCGRWGRDPLVSLVTVPREGQASLGPGRAGIHSVHSRPPIV